MNESWSSLRSSLCHRFWKTFADVVQEVDSVIVKKVRVLKPRSSEAYWLGCLEDGSGECASLRETDRNAMADEARPRDKSFAARGVEKLW